MSIEPFWERRWRVRRVLLVILSLGAAFVAVRAVPSQTFGGFALLVRALVTGTTAAVTALVLDAIMRRRHHRAG